MPYSKCPICGAISHLSVGDVQQWYAEYYPGVPVGKLVPGKCFNCWPELAAGMPVVVRPVPAGNASDRTGSRGQVERVLSASSHGTIYLVRLGSGEERYFIRAELRKLRESEAEPGALADRPRE